MSGDERRERLGQVGSVVRLSAPALDAALALAFAVERELFDRGYIATVLEGATEEAAAACAHGGLIALIPARSEGGLGVFAEVFGDRVAASDGEDAEDFVRRAAEVLLSRSK